MDSETREVRKSEGRPHIRWEVRRKRGQTRGSELRGPEELSDRSEQEFVRTSGEKAGGGNKLQSSHRSGSNHPRSTNQEAMGRSGGRGQRQEGNPWAWSRPGQSLMGSQPGGCGQRCSAQKFEQKQEAWVLHYQGPAMNHGT